MATTGLHLQLCQSRRRNNEGEYSPQDLLHYRLDVWQSIPIAEVWRSVTNLGIKLIVGLATNTRVEDHGEDKVVQCSRALFGISTYYTASKIQPTVSAPPRLWVSHGQHLRHSLDNTTITNAQHHATDPCNILIRQILCFLSIVQ